MSNISRLIQFTSIVNHLIFIISHGIYTFAQPEGWRMIDRFGGFRYEVKGEITSKDIQKKADSLACFGWTQETERDSFVGEVRCFKDRAKDMKQWLQFNENVKSTDFKDYEDTKIRLHFSHFKILNKNRDTCFPDLPHRCTDEFHL